MAKTRCPDCGKKVPEGVLACPRCGHSVAAAYLRPARADAAASVAEEEWDAPFTESDEEIDDPALLEQVEHYVKGLADLPYQGRGRRQSMEDTEDAGDVLDDPSDDQIFDPELLEQAEAYVKGLPDVLFRSSERGPNGHRNGRVDTDSDRDAEAREPETAGGECPACGRQAQPGWEKCPWCGVALTADGSGTSE